MVSKAPRIVHGDDLLYRFFTLLITDRPDFAPEILSRLYTSMGIWFPMEVYRRLPVLLPWVVRDPSCRGNQARGIADQWGAPDRSGLFRDDNSLVKALPRSLVINAMAMPHLHRARMGKDFVAAHIWRIDNSGDLVSRNPLLNTFVPNLVWLPAQVAKLTDREGSLMQTTLQAIAWNRYRHQRVDDHLREIVEKAWSYLPKPTIATEFDDHLNEFDTPERFFKTREDKIRLVIDALEKVATGENLSKKVVSSRYTEGLPNVAHQELIQLTRFLQTFAKSM